MLYIRKNPALMDQSSHPVTRPPSSPELGHPPQRVREVTCARSQLSNRYEALLLDEVEGYLRAARRYSTTGTFELVDLGGFPGVWARVVATKFPMVSCYAYDKLFTRTEPIAIRLRTRGELRPLDISTGALEHPDSSVDLASMLFVSHFLADAALSRALSELNRILRPGALLVHSGLHPSAPEMPRDFGPADQQVVDTVWLGEKTIVHHRGPVLMERIFASHGFAIAQHIDLFGVESETKRLPFGRISMLRRI